MSAIDTHPQGAALLQLLDALQAYEQDVRQFIAPRIDPEAYHRVRLGLDEIRRCSMTFPEFSVSWAELLIRHFELAHVRWQVEQKQLEADRLSHAFAVHTTAIEALRSRSQALMAMYVRPPGAGHIVTK